MSQLVDEYGEFISLHKGVGNLNDTICSFEVGQKSDSTIIFHCSSKEIFDPDTRSIVLSGFLDDGTPINAEGKVSPRCSLAIDDDDTNSQCYFRSFAVFRLCLGAPEWSDVNEVRFSIANFVFCGTDDGIGNGREKLEINLGGFEAYFEKLGNYENIVESLLRKGMVGVTCDLVIKLSDQTIEQTIEFANDVCILLAIATGRTVDWLKMRLFDSKSSLLSTQYQHRRISSVQAFDIIDFQDVDVAVTYLKQCYPTYKQVNPKYHIDTVAFVLGDLRPHPLLETRALLMYSIADSFTKKVSINDSLEARLKHLLNTFKVSYKSEEARRFAKSRNSISHEYEFENTDERDEYFRNLNLFHRLLLRMLGYDSYYNDVTKLANNTGSLRQKLKVAIRPPGR